MRAQNKKIAIMISYVTMIVQIAVTFSITPFILNRLGSTEYGVYEFVASTVTYLSLLGFGFSSAYIRFYSRYKNKNDNEGIASLNGMFLTLFIIMAFACFIIGGILYSNTNLVFGNKLDASQIGSAKTILVVLALNMAISFPKSIFVCNTTAHEQFVFQKSITLLIDILLPALKVLFICLVNDVCVLAYATLIVTVIDFIIKFVYNVFYLKMKFRFGHFDFGLLREITGFTFFIFLNQILDILSSTNIDVFLIGHIVGPKAVTQYSIGGKLNSMFYSVASPVSAVFVPMIYRIAEENDDKQRKLSLIFSKVGKLQFSLLYLVLSGFIIWGKHFLTMWVGTGYEDSYYIAIVLMACHIIALSQNIGIEIQRAENKHRVRSIVYLIIDLANVFISIPLIKSFGPIGASIGTALAMVLGTVLFMNAYYYFAIGLNIFVYWKNIFKIICFTLPCVFTGYLLMRLISVHSVFDFIIQIGTYSVLYFVIIVLFILTEEERHSLNIINKIRRKK